MSIHHFGRLGVLKTFVLHYMTPVAGRVPDGEENGLVFPFRAFQSLGPPRVPVDGVISVLLQVRARFVDQSIGGAFIAHFYSLYQKVAQYYARTRRIKG